MGKPHFSLGGDSGGIWNAGALGQEEMLSFP